MVPFPEGHEDYINWWGQQSKPSRALVDDPHGNGLILPKPKEALTKSREFLWKIARPESYHAESAKAAVGHGILNYWFRVLAAGFGHDPVLGNIFARTVRRRLYNESRKHYESITKIRKDKIPEIVEEMKDDAKFAVDDEDERRAYIITAPKIIRSAQILEDAVEKHPEGNTTYEKFANLISKPNPVRIVKNYIKDPQTREEFLENLYKLHVQFAQLLPEFFEDKSDLEYVIPADKRKRWREEALRELETGSEEEKKQQAAGRIVATFEERAFAEEFASLKGGNVVQTPEGKYAVVLEENVKPQTTQRIQDERKGETHTPQAGPRRHWVEELLGIPKEQIKKHPETGYEYVEKDGKIIILPSKDPRTLGLRGPDLPNGGLEKTDVPATVEYSKDPINELQEIRNMFREVEQGIREGRFKNLEDIRQYAEKKNKELQERDYRVATTTAEKMTYAIEAAPRGTKPEHIAEEYRYAVLMLGDAAKLAKDMLSHPEKYGITEEDRKKGEEYVREKLSDKIQEMIKGKYMAFHYR